MTKLKLIILSTVLLATQINGIIIKTNRSGEELNISDLDNLFEQTTMDLNLTEFHSILDILHFLKKTNDDYLDSLISEDEAITNTLRLLEQEQQMKITILSKIKQNFICNFISKALEILIPEDTIPEPMPMAITSSRPAASASHSLPPEIQATARAIQPGPIRSPIRMPISKSPLLKIIKQITASTDLAETKRLLNGCTLRDLNSMLAPEFHIDRPESLEILTKTIAEKLQSPEVLEEFKTNPRAFTAQYHNFNIEPFKRLIFQNFPSYPGIALTTSIDHSESISSMANSPDGKIIITGSHDGTIISSIMNSDNLTYSSIRLTGQTSAITAIAILSGTQFVSGGMDGSIIIWTLISHKSYCAKILPSIYECKISSIAQISTNEFIIGYDNGMAVIWTKNPIDNSFNCVEFRPHNHSINAISIFPNKKIATVSSDRTIKIWSQNPITGEMSPVTLTDHKHGVTSITILSDEQFITSSLDDTTRFWQLSADGKFTSKILFIDNSMITELKMLPTGQIVTKSIDRKTKIWTKSTIDGKYYPFELRGPQQSAFSLGVLPTGEILTGFRDNSIKAWINIPLLDLTVEQALLVISYQAPLEEFLRENESLREIFNSLPDNIKIILNSN